MRKALILLLLASAFATTKVQQQPDRIIVYKDGFEIVSIIKADEQIFLCYAKWDAETHEVIWVECQPAVKRPPLFEIK